MFGLELQDKIPCSEIGKRTNIIDIIECTLKQKWRWAGNIARMKDNKWTKRRHRVATKEREEIRGRPSRRWQDYIAREEGITWNRKTTARGQ